MTVQIFKQGPFLDKGQSGNSGATLRASQWGESNSTPAFCFDEVFVCLFRGNVQKIGTTAALMFFNFVATQAVQIFK